MLGEDESVRASPRRLIMLRRNEGNGYVSLDVDRVQRAALKQML